METKNAQMGDRIATPAIQDCVYALHVINDLLTDLVNADDTRPAGECRKYGYQIGGLLAAERVIIRRLVTIVGGM